MLDQFRVIQSTTVHDVRTDTASPGDLPMLPARILSGAGHLPGLWSERCFPPGRRAGAGKADAVRQGRNFQRPASRFSGKLPGMGQSAASPAITWRNGSPRCPSARSLAAECRPSRPPDARRGGRRGHRRARGEAADTGGVSWTRLAPPRHGVAKPQAQETILAAVVDPARSTAARRRGGSEGGRAAPSTGRRAAGSGPRDPLVFRVEGRYPIV